MAKRFTDSNKWQDDWFGQLPNDYRIIWLWLVDTCTHYGTWKKDFRGLNFNCNVNIDEAKFNEIFSSRVIDKGNYYFIPKFITYQYPSGLNSNKPMIVSIKKELEKLMIIELLDNRYLTIKDKVMDKVMERDKEMVKDKELTIVEVDVAQNFKNDVLAYSNIYPEKMITDFCGYWLEKSPKGKKHRFEMEKVFDISRRLTTWASRVNNFSGGVHEKKSLNDKFADIANQLKARANQ